MKNKRKNTGIETLAMYNIEQLRAEMRQLLEQQPTIGLYSRLLEVGLDIREGIFIEAKRNRAGFQSTLKIILALQKLPTTATKLSRLSLKKIS